MKALKRILYVPGKDKNIMCSLYIEMCIKRYVEQKGWDVPEDDGIEVEACMIYACLPENLIETLNANVPKKRVQSFIYHCCVEVGEQVKKRYKFPQKRRYGTRDKGRDVVFNLYSEGKTVEEIVDETDIPSNFVFKALGDRKRRLIYIPKKRVVSYVLDRSLSDDERDMGKDYIESLLVRAGMFSRKIRRGVARIKTRRLGILWDYAQGMRILEIAERNKCTRAYVYMVINEYEGVSYSSPWIEEVKNQIPPEWKERINMEYGKSIEGTFFIEEWVKKTNLDPNKILEGLAAEGNRIRIESRQKSIPKTKRQYKNHFLLFYLLSNGYYKKDAMKRVGCSESGLRHIVRMHPRKSTDKDAPLVPLEEMKALEKIMFSDEPFDLKDVKWWLKSNTGVDYDSYGMYGILYALGLRQWEKKQ